jgi:hypothetical protein
MVKTPKQQRVNLKSIFLGLQEEMIATLSTTRKNVKHPGSKGDVSENSWLKMLKTYLPHRYQAEKAFVLDSEGSLSQQIDIVVFDRHFSPFLFHREGACYIPAESVYAVFEVKQSLNKNIFEYASEKAASVRKLKRTSAHISHAGGKFDPQIPKEILAGFLTLSSSWKPCFGSVFDNATQNLTKEGKLNIGCVLNEGAFACHEDEFGISHVAKFPKSQALIRFFLTFLNQLQSIGSVPAIDIKAYASSLSD